MRIVLQSVSDLLPLDVIFFRNKFGFLDSDSFLIEVIKLAINNIEVRAGISILEKVWKVIHNNHQVALLNGPIIDILSIQNSKGQALEPLSKIRRNDNLILNFHPSVGWVTVFYKAGYNSSNLPECLKNTIISEFFKIYEQNEQKLSDQNQCQSDFEFNYLFG